MKHLLLSLFLTALYVNATAQNYSTKDPNYITYVKAGEAALKSEKYDSCLHYFAAAFQIKQTSFLSTLRGAACAYSLDNQEILTAYLDTAFALNWDQSKEIVYNYPEFEYLKGSAFFTMIDTRWNDAAIKSGLDMELRAELAEIRRTDQLHRGMMRDVSSQYGWDSPQMDSLWALQNEIDSLNQLRITEIIDNQGYPGKSKVGPGQSGTGFLVIQHADIETQEKYLPILTEEANKGELRWSSLALLIDRVALRQGGKQIYGSQVNGNEQDGFYFGPIEQPMKVDSLREAVGLGPLQQYADNWNFKWSPKDHINRYKDAEIIID